MNIGSLKELRYINTYLEVNSLDGHQLSFPHIATMLGIKKGRTTNVSISTPSIIAKPSCIISLKGRVVSTKNVPAKIMPADVTTPPVFPTAEAIPSLKPLTSISSLIRDITKIL